MQTILNLIIEEKQKTIERLKEHKLGEEHTRRELHADMLALAAAFNRKFVPKPGIGAINEPDLQNALGDLRATLERITSLYLKQNTVERMEELLKEYAHAEELAQILSESLILKVQ